MSGAGCADLAGTARIAAHVGRAAPREGTLLLVVAAVARAVAVRVARTTGGASGRARRAATAVDVALVAVLDAVRARGRRARVARAHQAVAVRADAAGEARPAALGVARTSAVDVGLVSVLDAVVVVALHAFPVHARARRTIAGDLAALTDGALRPASPAIEARLVAVQDAVGMRGDLTDLRVAYSRLAVLAAVARAAVIVPVRVAGEDLARIGREVGLEPVEDGAARHAEGRSGPPHDADDPRAASHPVPSLRGNAAQGTPGRQPGA